MSGGIVTFAVPGYAPGLTGLVPPSNDVGATNPAAVAATNLRIPPALWMFIFLVVGYVGLRMILED